jgi:hypothetical protein
MNGVTVSINDAYLWELLTLWLFVLIEIRPFVTYSASLLTVQSKLDSIIL